MEFANNRKIGDPSSTSSQLDCFNNLYYFSDRNDAIYKQEKNTRVDKTAFMTTFKNNVDNQLPNSLFSNGRPYPRQQEFKSDLVIIRPMSYYENGRDLSLFRATDDKYVDVSGTLFKNSDLRSMPIATTRRANILPLRDMKIATNEYVKAKTGMGTKIYPPRRKEINLKEINNTHSVISNDASMMRFNVQKASLISSTRSSTPYTDYSTRSTRSSTTYTAYPASSTRSSTPNLWGDIAQQIYF